MRRRLAASFAAALVLTGVTACSGSSSSSSGIDGLTVSGKFGQQPTVKVDGLKESSAKSDVLITGKGPKLSSNGAAKYQVLMAKGTDGSTIQSSFSSSQPQTLQLSKAPSWVKSALSGVPIGSRVAIVTPLSQLNNGQPAPQLNLTAKDDVVMIFDLIGTATAPLTGPKGTAVTPPASAPKVIQQGTTISALDFSKAPKKPPTKLEVIPLIKGTGAALKAGDPMRVNYFSTVWGNGTKPFDSTYKTGQPADLQLTSPPLIKGWTQGLTGVKAGSRVMLVIPPKLGYGAKGQPPTIPGNATLVFVIDVLQAGA